MKNWKMTKWNNKAKSDYNPCPPTPSVPGAPAGAPIILFSHCDSGVCSANEKIQLSPHTARKKNQFLLRTALEKFTASPKLNNWGVQNKKDPSGNLDFQNKKDLSGTSKFLFHISSKAGSTFDVNLCRICVEFDTNSTFNVEFVSN